MTIVHRQVTCTTTPQLVVTVDNQPQEVHLHNIEKSSNNYIYIGSENVSTTNSIHLDPGESKVLSLPAGNELYAVSDPSGLDLGIMQIQKRD